MCRSIVTLRSVDHAASEEDVRAAARQFVRKVSGYRVPSRRNEEAFEQAIDEIAVATRRLLDGVAGPGARATPATAAAAGAAAATASGTSASGSAARR